MGAKLGIRAAAGYEHMEARGRPKDPHVTGAGGRVVGLGLEMGAQGLLGVPLAWAGLTHVPSAACGRVLGLVTWVCWPCRALALHVQDACRLKERGAGARRFWGSSRCPRTEEERTSGKPCTAFPPC